jgi:peptidoglycan/xylan/chitin deacetylase (PgdA/CDA1 family)
MSAPAPSRREFLAAAAATGAAALTAPPPVAAMGAAAATPAAPGQRKALVAITLDLEMARNFPRWEQTHWDYEKGNLNDETKAYAAEAARRVKAAGGLVHFFLVGRALEQADVSWLRRIADDGHPIGNHTYDHVNVLATRREDIQFRFRRAPWLVEGKEPADVIRENVRLATAALEARLGIAPPAGFRTPGGFAEGLAGRDDVQRMLRGLGFDWVSSKYPAHPMGQPARKPDAAVYDGIVAAQRAAQPFAYPGGLVEVPMSPVSDIGAFRNGRWELGWFLEAVRLGVEWAVEQGGTYDFLGHPACLYVTDPQFRTVDLICDLVARAGDRAALATLDALAARARQA